MSKTVLANSVYLSDRIRYLAHMTVVSTNGGNDSGEEKMTYFVNSHLRRALSRHLSLGHDAVRGASAPAKAPGCRPRWQQNLACCLLPCLLLAAGCSSGNSEAEADNTAQPTTNPQSDSPDNMPPADMPAPEESDQEESDQDQSDQDQSDQDQSDQQQSDTQRLMAEIKLAAAEPLLTLNAKIGSGETLAPEELQCLGSFDPALGEAPTSISCDTPLLAGDSIVIVSQASVENSDACQGSLGQGNLTACDLKTADVLIPIEWVTRNQIQRMPAGVQPIAGAKIKYNLDDNGLLILSESNTLTGTFNCTIDIATAELSGEPEQAFNCNQEVVRIADRLGVLRAVRAVSLFMP